MNDKLAYGFGFVPSEDDLVLLTVRHDICWMTPNQMARRSFRGRSREFHDSSMFILGNIQHLKLDLSHLWGWDHTWSLHDPNQKWVNDPSLVGNDPVGVYLESP